MASLQELEKDLGKLKERNKNVEADKAWETSWARKIVIFLLTYAAITVYFSAVGLPDPFLNSFVPALAFVISTLTLPYFKELWAKYSYKK